jgi:hypothetical protein
MAAIDNVIVYQEGQREAPVASPPDLVAVMGGDNGLLRLVVAPEIRSFQDARVRNSILSPSASPR